MESNQPTLIKSDKRKEAKLWHTRACRAQNALCVRPEEVGHVSITLSPNTGLGDRTVHEPYKQCCTNYIGDHISPIQPSSLYSPPSVLMAWCARGVLNKLEPVNKVPTRMADAAASSECWQEILQTPLLSLGAVFQRQQLLEPWESRLLHAGRLWWTGGVRGHRPGEYNRVTSC